MIIATGEERGPWRLVHNAVPVLANLMGNCEDGFPPKQGRKFFTTDEKDERRFKMVVIVVCNALSGYQLRIIGLSSLKSCNCCSCCNCCLLRVVGLSASRYRVVEFEKL